MTESLSGPRRHRVAPAVAILRARRCPDHVGRRRFTPPLPGSGLVCACAGAGSLAGRPAGERPRLWVSPGLGGEPRPGCPRFWRDRREPCSRAAAWWPGELQALLAHRARGPAEGPVVLRHSAREAPAPSRGRGRNRPLSAPRGIAEARASPWRRRFCAAPSGPQ